MSTTACLFLNRFSKALNNDAYLQLFLLIWLLFVRSDQCEYNFYRLSVKAIFFGKLSIELFKTSANCSILLLKVFRNCMKFGIAHKKLLHSYKSFVTSSEI